MLSLCPTLSYWPKEPHSDKTPSRYENFLKCYARTDVSGRGENVRLLATRNFLFGRSAGRYPRRPHGGYRDVQLSAISFLLRMRDAPLFQDDQGHTIHVIISNG